MHRRSDRETFRAAPQRDEPPLARASADRAAGSDRPAVEATADRAPAVGDTPVEASADRAPVQSTSVVEATGVLSIVTGSPSLPGGRVGAGTVGAIAADLAGGGMAVVVDRTGVGALVVAASHADAGTVNVLAREARGLVCLALTPDRCARLGLRRMREADEIRPGRDLLVTIEAREGTTTGISTADRARTVAAAVAPGAVPGDLVSPGHVVPLRTAAGGVHEVAGTAEAALDLLRIAGADPSAVHCAVLDDDGEPATGEALRAVVRRLGAALVTVDAVLAHRDAVPAPRAA